MSHQIIAYVSTISFFKRDLKLKVIPVFQHIGPVAFSPCPSHLKAWFN